MTHCIKKKLKDYVSSQDTKLSTIQVDSSFKLSEAKRSLTKESIRHNLYWDGRGNFKSEKLTKTKKEVVSNLI